MVAPDPDDITFICVSDKEAAVHRAAAAPFQPAER